MSVPFYSATIPIKCTSTLNSREHWAVRAKKVKEQRELVDLCLKQRHIMPVVVVRLTRIGPRKLDSDNLQGALKGVRDQVAAVMRLDDASPLVRWEYAQASGEYGVGLDIEAVP